MSDRGEADHIAIVGMAGRFPGADDVDQLWANLCAGVESIRPFSDAELDAAGVDASVRADPAFVNAGAVLDGADHFDADLFGISRREAELMDPQHRVFLECAHTALEHAGCDPRRFDGRIGVFGGVAANTYLRHNLSGHQELLRRTGDYPLLLATEREYAITRVAYKLGLDGPAISVNTACSTSAVAVHLASQSLVSGGSDLALAGGARIRVPLTAGYRYEEDGILSPDGHCRPFDADARGTVAASGAAMIVLKRLSDALDDGDTVYAVIRGSAVNNDGAAKIGYTAPGVQGQMAVIEEALAVADVDPSTVGMVEAHGTATALGDPIEASALTSVYRRHTDRRGYCAIGSLKSNIGHLDAGAGVAGIIKAALSLHHERIPPSLNFRRPNPQIDFDAGPFFVNTELRAWPRSDVPRRAGVSSFGLGGTNAHVVLEEAPAAAPASTASGRPQVLVLSGASEAATGRLRRDLAEHLDADPGADLADVAYTLQVGRTRMAHRYAIVASSRADAVQQLRERDATAATERVTAAEATDVAFLFPGQGAGYQGMGAGLYRSEPVFAAALDACAAVIDPIIGRSSLELMFGDGPDRAADRDVFAGADVAQPLTFSVEYAMARLWTSWGIEPSVMVGHSLGEFAAACIGGVFELEDALHLVAERGRMMQELAAGSMLAVTAEPAAMAPMLDDRTAIAAINAPARTVVSGPAGSIDQLERRLTADGVAVRTLPIGLAAHSPLMEPMVAPFRALVAAAPRGSLRIPMISTATGERTSAGQLADPDYWAEHVRSTVRFSDAVGQLLEHPETILLEVGPGATLSSLVRGRPDRARTQPVISTMPPAGQDTDDAVFALRALGGAWTAGADVDWAAVHAGPRRRVPLPTYPFERQRYWIEPAESPPPAESRQRGDQSAAHATEPVRAPEAPATAAATTLPMSRVDGIATTLRTILSDLSGVDAGDLDPGADFADLGFDSLFLTQANARFRAEFGIRVTFRQLFEEAPTITALASFIDRQLPGDVDPDAPTAAATDGARPAAIEPVPAEASSAEPPPPETDAGDELARPAPVRQTLSDRQRQAIEELVRLHDARTPRSKRLAQAWRARLADNRTIVGFDQAWKELVYQIVTDRSAGSRIWDVDGNEYVDTALGLGTNLLGHSPDVVTQAVREQLDRGFDVSAQSHLLGEVTDMVCAATGAERMAFISSGSEAVAAAIRVARTITGRDKVAYFRDDIHGRSDIVLGRPVEVGGELRTLPQVAGVPQRAIDDALVLAYGTDEALERVRAHASELALVLVEPVRTRNPDLQPVDFVRDLRRLADEYGFLLVFDEIVTGFRAHPGGVQAMWGIRPDISAYGKSLGGGMPIAAIAGRSEHIDVVDGGPWSFGDDSFPEADITASGGTFIKHPLALAAARAVLRHLEARGPSLQAELNRQASDAVAAINDAYTADGIAIHVEHFSSFFRPTFVRETRFAGLFHAYLREHGVLTNPPAPSFLSTAHSEADIEAVVDAYRAAGRAMAQAGFLDVPRPHRAAPSPWGTAPEPSLPLTDAQRDIWLISQLGDEAAAAYHVSSTLRLRGKLDLDALRRALQTLVERHGSLRITFDREAERQVVREPHVVDLPVVDIFESDDDVTRAERLEAVCSAELDRPFDLVAGPLFRVKLVRLGPAEHVLVMTAHHLIADGWSMGVLHRDLGALYSAYRGGGVPRLETAASFADYVAWDAAQRPGSERYWLDLYDALPRALDLPTDHGRQPVRAYGSRQARTDLDEALVADLRQLAAAEGVSLFTVLLGAWEMLLHRLSGQSDFAIGLVAAGQASMGVRDLVGSCANLVPLRSRVDPDESVSDFLRRLKWESYDAYDHQHYTVGKLASALQLQRRADRPTIVTTAITIETPTGGVSFDGLDVEPGTVATDFSAFDLAADLTESERAVTVELHYAESSFGHDAVGRWLGQYATLLRSMAAAPSSPTRSMRWLPDEERRELLHRWNPQSGQAPELLTHQLVERQAGLRPDATAVRTSTGSLTYAELDARAGRLAGRLRSLGVGPDRLVGVHLRRTAELPVALLAVHKAGGAYLPLDPGLPPARLEAIAAQAGLDALVTQPDLAGTVATGDVPTITLADEAPTDELDGSHAAVPPQPSDLAYVIYTSGSTGEPKGVEVSHLALANDLTAMLDRPGIEPDDVLLAVTTISFDPAVEELFLPLIAGGTVVIADETEAVDATWLRDRLATADISVMNATPATWRMLIDAGWRGTPHLKALCGGEALDPELAAAIRQRVGSLWNVYGTTETTISSAVSEVHEGDAAIALGEPIANTELHVLDGTLEPQPYGVPGDLYVGGLGLARGYRGQPGLTADRFVSHAFDGEPARRLYRTGDRVRRAADGRLEFLGRDDHQVKIRGYRIELGEIEAVLGRHPAIAAPVVVARDGADGGRRLIAYLVPATDQVVDASAVRAFLRERLPEYMTPSRFVVIDELPLTAAQKVDRERLPDPDRRRPRQAAALIAPRTGTEVALAGIWRELLDLHAVGVDDNFFDLGGDSLLALRCVLRGNDLGLALTPISMLRHQTIAELARALEDGSVAAGRDEGLTNGPLPLTPAQRRFLERETPDPHHWNVSALVAVPALDADALREALRAVLAHHDALRLTVRETEDGWRGAIDALADDLPFRSVDLSDVPLRERAAAVEAVCAELQGDLDLARGPQLRVAHLYLGPDEPDRLFVSVHHFAIDGLSWPVFWGDLEAAYRQAASGEHVALPPTTASFRDWAIGLEQLAQTPRVVETAGEWTRLPWRDVAPLPLDLDADAGANTYASTDVVETVVDAADSRRLSGQGVPPQRVITAALARILGRWTASPAVLMDVLGHGRDAAFEGVNLSRTVGFAISYNPLVLAHPTWAPGPDLLRSVVAQIDAHPEGFSFELLRFMSADAVLRDRLTQLPRSQVLFHYDAWGYGPGDEASWPAAPEPRGPDDSPRALRQYALSVRAAPGERMRLWFAYSTNLHLRSTIEAVAGEVVTTIGALLRADDRPGRTGARRGTPAPRP